jgi:Site-specific recombinase XerD
MHEALAEFLRHLSLEKNASAYTIKSYREDLNQALEFFREKAGLRVTEPRQVSTRHVRAYLAWLHEQRYSKATIARRMAAVRSWFRFLCRQGMIETNPADGCEVPGRTRSFRIF